ncbi:MAG: hypothetical protein KDC45_09635 [Bacteroidetes bacterium]|nr:hypothetical protein [Bacteroidota bacterium]
MKKLSILIIGGLLITGCGASVRQMSQTDWQASKTNMSGKKASIVIGKDIEFGAQLLGVSGGNLLIDQNGVPIELPEEVVTNIRITGAGAKNNMMIGGVVGALVGFGGGYAVGSAAGEGGVGAIFHPLSMVVILGSTVGGVFIGSNMTQSSEFKLANRPLPYILSSETGSEIGASTLSAFGLFENLSGIPNEKVVQVTIYSLTSGKYLLVYDVRVGTGFQVRWKIVDENYIALQKAKINSQG